MTDDTNFSESIKFAMPTAEHPAVSAPTPVISISPVVLPAPGRGVDLPVRVSAPATGSQLPIIVFSHGNGKSLDAYEPLVQLWAAHGFVVLQCTHLDSRRLAIPPDDPRTRGIWRFRVEDMKRMLDNFDGLEASVPGLKGRVDQSRIAAAGHSFGGQTVGMLLGARIFDSDGKPGESLTDARVKAGVLLATAGRGGKDRTPFTIQHLPHLDPDFRDMTTPALVVVGDKDVMPLLTTRGADWGADPYVLSPGRKCLLTVFGGEHLLGGISGFEAKETTDENPSRVALVQQLTCAYLRSELYSGDSAWPAAKAALMESANPQGRVECK